MRAWTFQDTRQKQRLGDKCPWSVGWLDPDGKRRSKRVGAKSMAEKFRLKKETELEHGIASPRAVTWAEFRKRYDETILESMSHGNREGTSIALTHFERLIKPKRMEGVTTHAVDLYKTRRGRERGRKPDSLVSPATINKELRHLRAVFNIAEDWGLLGKAPKVRMKREPERDPEFVDDAMFDKLYTACATMERPMGANYSPQEWWQALLTFAYLTGWRVNEILALRRDDVDLATGTAFLAAESTKGRRDARAELHPVVIDHLRTVLSFDPLVFPWQESPRRLWADFAKLKEAAGVEFKGAFHRLRFGFANSNVDNVPADVLQRMMRHRAASTTQGYINKARRMRSQGTVDKLHVPATFASRKAN
jgi:integrase